MSETAYIPPVDPETGEVADVIDLSTPSDPMGSFFDPFPDEAAAAKLLEHGSSEQKKLLTTSSGTSLLIHLLEEARYLPPVPVITPRTQLKAEGVSHPEKIQKAQSAYQKQVLQQRKPIIERVDTTTKEYREFFWEDYATGKGFDADKIEQLADVTTEYADTSDIYRVLATLHQQYPGHAPVIEATRILQLLLLEEHGHTSS